MSMGLAPTQREVIVVLPEDIALINATRIAEQLTLAVSHGSTTIIDMTATTFCDWAGARAIVQAHKRATGSGAELRLVIVARASSSQPGTTANSTACSTGSRTLHST